LALKGLDGALETIGGVLVWFVTPALVDGIFQALYGHMGFRAAHSHVTNHLLNSSENFAGGRKLFASLFLLSHGVTKIVLVTALWLGKMWAYPLLIIIFTSFCVYQAYRFAHTHSVVLALLTLLDIVVVGLACAEYRDQLGAEL